jgi:CBS domain-containing protein
VTATDQSLRLIGIITDRDICMAAHFHGKSLKDLRVSDAMVKEVYCCSPKDVLEDAEGIMRKARVRRLPIINKSKQVVGLISLADLARQALRERSSKKRAISEAEIGEVLATICEPRQIGSQTPLS